MSNSRNKPLEGYRVLDLATMIAAPLCASILGEFGAEVIKVEMPGTGDPLRSFGTMNSRGSSFNWLNEARNKKSVTLDLRTPEGLEIIKKLIATCDVVVENFRPGTLEKWGLGYDVIKEIKDDVILVRVSAYGQNGPYRNRPGYARVAQGYSGLTHLAGEAEGRPVVPGSTALADYVSGVYAGIGALLAIIARNRFNVGQSVDVALYEGVFRFLDELAPVYQATGYVRNRMGADTVNAAPHSHYETKNGRWVALACSSDKMWERLCKVMRRMDLATPETFKFVDQRIARKDDINTIVQEWMSRHDYQEIIELCLQGDVPLGPINTIADIFDDEHFEARQNLLQLEAPELGMVAVPNIVPRLSETPGEVRSLGPLLGEHNEEVYGEIGLTKEDMCRLTGKKII